jgi:hypothetical protein
MMTIHHMPWRGVNAWGPSAHFLPATPCEQQVHGQQRDSAPQSAQSCCTCPLSCNTPSSAWPLYCLRCLCTCCRRSMRASLGAPRCFLADARVWLHFGGARLACEPSQLWSRLTVPDCLRCFSALTRTHVMLSFFFQPTCGPGEGGAASGSLDGGIATPQSQPNPSARVCESAGCSEPQKVATAPDPRAGVGRVGGAGRKLGAAALDGPGGGGDRGPWSDPLVTTAPIQASWSREPSIRSPSHTPAAPERARWESDRH